VDSTDVEIEDEPRAETPVKAFIENSVQDKPVEIYLQDLNSSDFQVVTRRRRKNSQSNTSSSPTPVADKSKIKGSRRRHSNSPPLRPTTPSKETDKKTCQETPPVRKEVNISSLCLDTKESLAELLQTKTLLEENITRLTELSLIKSGCIDQMTRDKDTKLDVLGQHNQQLLTLKTQLELKVQEQRKVLEGLELEVEEVDIQIKRGKEKEARMKMYLDMNIADASNELMRLGGLSMVFTHLYRIM